MTKYHISKSGKPAVCHAEKGACPLGGPGEHYDTPEEAQHAIDKEQAKAFIEDSRKDRLADINEKYEKRLQDLIEDGDRTIEDYLGGDSLSDYAYWGHDPEYLDEDLMYVYNTLDKMVEERNEERAEIINDFKEKGFDTYDDYKQSIINGMNSNLPPVANKMDVKKAYSAFRVKYGLRGTPEGDVYLGTNAEELGRALMKNTDIDGIIKRAAESTGQDYYEFERKNRTTPLQEIVDKIDYAKIGQNAIDNGSYIPTNGMFLPARPRGKFRGATTIYKGMNTQEYRSIYKKYGEKIDAYLAAGYDPKDLVDNNNIAFIDANSDEAEKLTENYIREHGLEHLAYSDNYVIYDLNDEDDKKTFFDENELPYNYNGEQYVYTFYNAPKGSVLYDETYIGKDIELDPTDAAYAMSGQENSEYRYSSGYLIKRL